jgi:hypothetical protein
MILTGGAKKHNKKPAAFSSAGAPFRPNEMHTPFDQKSQTKSVSKHARNAETIA